MAKGQSGYWQQQVNYTIDVTLHDKDNTLDAFEKIEYTNNSPDTLTFIWFHLWPNAYKNDRTAFSNQELINGNTKFYFSDKEQRGYINRLDFKVNNITCNTEDHPQYIDVIKVLLPSPLPPHQTIILTTPFHEKLPFNFSRGGYDGESYQVSQWYPKPAVYDRTGWHPMPYLDQGEFYSEFGNFDVRITVPKNYVVAATGELQNDQEKNWLLSRKNFSWVPQKQKTKTKNGIIKITTQKFPASDGQTKTLQYLQDNVHDFAWFADKRFIVNYDTCQLASGKIIDVYTYYTPQQKNVWKNSVQFAKRSVRFYSLNVGEYPYRIVSAVQGPLSFGGGMEYPTITIISPVNSEKALDVTMAHEIGHNWFYGVLATNERDHPWMDEGINNFYEHRYTESFYHQSASTPEKTFFETFATGKLDQSIETTSENFNETNYNLVAYYKTSEWLRWLEQQLGKENFDKAMHEYFLAWQFKHPQPADLKYFLEKSAGKNLDSVFSYLTKKGILPNQTRIGTKLLVFPHPAFFKTYLNNQTKNLITIGPAIGRNGYDGFMPGIFITNIKLPLNAFHFFAVPLYSSATKKFRGLGRIEYSFYPGGVFRKIDLFTSASTFAMNTFTDTASQNFFLSFKKVVPGFRLTFKERDPRSTTHRFIQWKTFIFGEDILKFKRDSIITPVDTTIFTNIHKATDRRYVNQVEGVIENYRALYPYRAELKIEQADRFVRAGFTGNYFFNYPKKGGLEVRFFAGKFFYIVPKTTTNQFLTDRYHLNLTGPNGYEDYTYSDYFLGRNKFRSLPSQQIMVRDGGFKIKTDLLANKVGKTDDWLMAANFTSTIPKNINPLSLLPIDIPLKVFADIGTYSDAWKQNSELDHFVYEGGLQISLLKNTVNIYIPLVYSPIYKNYIQSALEKTARFFKKMSFSIDISHFSMRKIDPHFTF